MDKIKIQDLKIYAYHGVHETEHRVGQWYTVNLELNGTFFLAKSSDDLHGTIDYAAVTALVKAEMAQASKLIEHVAQRIATSLKSSFLLLESGTVEVVKENPPVKGVGSVSVTVEI